MQNLCPFVKWRQNLPGVSIHLRLYLTINRYRAPKLAEHEIFPANKSQITNNCKFFLAKYS